MADVSDNFSTDNSSASEYNNGPKITGTPSTGKSETCRYLSLKSMIRTRHYERYFFNFYFQEHHVPFWRVLMKISFCSDPIPKLSLHLNRFDNKRWMTSMGTSCSPPSCLKPPSARKDRSASGFMSIWYQHLELTKLKFYDIEGQNWVIVSQYFKSFKYFNNMLVTTSLCQ